MTYDELVDEAAKLGGWTISGYGAIRRYDPRPECASFYSYCPISAVMHMAMGRYYTLDQIDQAQAILGLSIDTIKRIASEADNGDEALFKRLTT